MCCVRKQLCILTLYMLLSLEGTNADKKGNCPSIKSTESEEVVCKLNGRTVSCEDVESNTTAVVRCKPFFTFPGLLPIYKCQDGKWDQNLVSCYPECGLKRIGATTLAVGGTETIKNEYPWVVGIYKMGNYICVGTIISRNYVLSVAHCFTNSKGEPVNKDDFTIIAGKYYRDINVEEPLSQARKIKTLFIHEDYKGSLRQYSADIALIKVDTEFILSLEVEPVCVDWEDAYGDIDFTNGKNGILAGWGFTKEEGSLSDVLKKIVIPYRSRDVCLEHLPRDFSDRFFYPDKICGGYTDRNVSVCSGGGWYFKSDGSKYFIRGILSLTVKSYIVCNTNQYALYTKVSKYLPWIENITRKIL